MDKKNYYFIGDSTRERGAKIMDALIKLGGKFKHGLRWDGDSRMYNYYFIDKEGYISNLSEEPYGYVKCEPEDILNEKKNVYPKWMNVYDYETDTPLKRLVFCEAINPVTKNLVYLAWSQENASGGPVSWLHAEDIPDESKITELTMDDIAKLAGVPVEQLKIKK